MIEFKKVSKKYGKVKVLDKIDLKITNGELVSIIGHSGAGKSTLIHLLIGAEKPSEGDVLVDDFVINKMNDKELQYYRRKIGVVFQDYKLLEQKNVFENVAFALEVCGWENNDIKKRTSEVLLRVGLGNKKNRLLNQLSGGEKQRLAIARALAHNPNLIVADEPTGNLDPIIAKDIINLLLDINSDGTTVIVTTHNKELVNYMKKRVIVLEDGKVKKDKKDSTFEY